MGEIRALLPSGAPMLAATATVTKAIRQDICRKLEMMTCNLVCSSPDRPNIYYKVVRCTDIEQDMYPLVEELRKNKIQMQRVVVYCRSLNLYSSMNFYFLTHLGAESYYPTGATEISDNRLFGVFHAQTPQHNKDVILTNMQSADGVIRVVFAAIALGISGGYRILPREVPLYDRARKFYKPHPLSLTTPIFGPF